MKLDYRHAKNERNIRERGLSFERVYEFEFEGATVLDATRREDPRRLAAGYLDDRLHILIYKPLNDGLRVISFGKASRMEAAQYGKELRRVPR